MYYPVLDKIYLNNTLALLGSTVLCQMLQFKIKLKKL